MREFRHQLDSYISCRTGTVTYPTVSSYTGECSLDSSSHSLAWSIPAMSHNDDTRSGLLVFSVNGDDPALFFPVKVNFAGQGCLAGVNINSVSNVNGVDSADFSVDASVCTGNYQVV